MRRGIDNYSFGFQGQEKDDELRGEGNSINYKYRMHDARIGRFFAVDPLTADYPWNSPYAFSENRVIDAIELEGLEAVNYKWKWNNESKSYDFEYRIENPILGSSGVMMTWEGGPRVPEGYDSRKVLTTKEGVILDMVSKNFGTVWEETRLVLQKTVTVGHNQDVTVSGYGLRAALEVEGVIVQMKETYSKDGLVIEYLGPNMETTFSAGFNAAYLNYSVSTNREESIGITFLGFVDLEQSYDSSGNEETSIMISYDQDLGVGINVEYGIGLLFKGKRLQLYRDVQTK